MARVTNEYTMLWELSTNSIIYDFRISMKGANAAFGNGTGIFEAQSLQDCYSKYNELGLNDNLGLMLDDPNISHEFPQFP